MVWRAMGAQWQSLLSCLFRNSFTKKETAVDRWSRAGNDTPATVNILFCYLKKGNLLCCSHQQGQTEGQRKGFT